MLQRDKLDRHSQANTRQRLARALRHCRDAPATWRSVPER